MESGRRWKCCDNRRWQVTLRDCTTMTWQDPNYCAHCYQEISSCSKTFKEELDYGPRRIAVVEALNNIFDIYRNSYRTEMILDDDYSLCQNCWMLLKRLYSSFTEFCDVSSSLSFLYAFVGSKTKRMGHRVILGVNVKQETDNDHLEVLPQFEESFWEGFLGMDGPEITVAEEAVDSKIFQGINTDESARPSFLGCSKGRQTRQGHVASATDTSVIKATSDDEISDDFHSLEARGGGSEVDEEGNIAYEYEDEVMPINSEDENSVSVGSATVEPTAPTMERLRRNYKKYVCEHPNCHKAFDRPGRLKRHQISHERKPRVRKTNRNYQRFVCGHPGCGKTFDRPSRLQLHTIRHKPKASERSMNFQMSKGDPDESKHTGVLGQDLSEVSPQSKASVTAEKKFREFRKRFVANLVMKANVTRNRVRDYRKYVCEYPSCGRAFDRPSRLKVHKSVHETEHHKLAREDLQITEGKIRVVENQDVLGLDGKSVGVHSKSDTGTENVHKFRRRLTSRIRKSTVTRNRTAEYRKYVCEHPDCDRAFDRPSRLELHKSTHNTEPYEILGEDLQTTEGTPSETGNKDDHSIDGEESTQNHSESNAGKEMQKFRRRHKATSRKSTDKRVRIRDYRKYVCDLPNCNKAFDRPSRLQFHKLMHDKKPFEIVLEDGRKRVECNVCGRQVVKTSLKGHLITHQSERPAVCEICGWAFKKLSDLKSHQRCVHSGERPYLCNVCGKSFKRSQHLVEHEIVVHSDKRPFNCNLCEKKFKQNSELRKHLRLHTGHRVRCEKCGIDFAWRSTLMKHLKTGCTGIPPPKSKKKGRKPTAKITYCPKAVDIPSADWSDASPSTQSEVLKNVVDTSENVNELTTTQESSHFPNSAPFFPIP